MSLQAELSQFTGTENYYKHFGGIVYTDGIRYLAEKAGCYWFIDLIASYQGEQHVKNESFQIWELKVNLKDNHAIATMQADTEEPYLIMQEIEFTDFPDEYLMVYCIDHVVLLPSEY